MKEVAGETNTVVRLGEIGLIDDTIDKGGKFPVVKRITYSKEKKTLGIACKDEDIGKMEKILYFVLYASESGADLALGKMGNSLIFLSSSGDGGYVIDEYIVQNPDDEMEALDIVEFHFSGHAHLEIGLSADEIKSQYGSNGVRKYLFMGMVVLGIAAYVLNDFLSSNSDVISIPPPPPPPPLVMNEIQEGHVKKNLSVDAIKELEKKAMEINADPFLKQHKKIANFSFREATFGGGEAGKYPIVSQEVTILFEYDFPADGTSKTGDNIYTQTEIINLKKQLSAGEIVEQIKMTPACADMILSVGGTISVDSRKETSIKFSFEKIKPAEVIGRYLEISARCPVYFESLNGASDSYSGAFKTYAGAEK